MTLLRAVLLGTVLIYSFSSPVLAQGHGPGGPGQGGNNGQGQGPGPGNNNGPGNGGGFNNGPGNDNHGGGFGPGQGDNHGGGFGPGQGDNHGGGFGPGHGGGFNPPPPPPPPPAPPRVQGPCTVSSFYNGGGVLYSATDAYGRNLTTNGDYTYVYDVAVNAEERGECSYIENSVPSTPRPTPTDYCQVLPGRNAFGQTYYNVVARSGVILYGEVLDYNTAYNESLNDARCFQ